VGTSPFTPNIPGAERKNVVIYRQVLTNEVKVGNRVVVVGGGLIGCETADFLAERGKKVTMAFFEPEPLIVYRRLRRFMVKILEKKNVRIMTEVKEFKRIAEDGIELVDKDGKTVFLKADNIVLATGVRSNKTLAQSLQGKVPQLYEAGDCIEPRRILEAVHEGADAALRI
jgi:pyruvate/2-oxoglutarate dehydrogenase complex dihydrolipoamide dehydrogenase (E3) component